MNKLYCDKKYLKYLEEYEPDDSCHKNCENCFTKEFWEEDVLCEADRHIIHWNKKGYYNIYSVVPVDEGGFYGTKFRITYKNGYTMECGLWYRGVCPNSVKFTKEISEVTEIKTVK